MKFFISLFLLLPLLVACGGSSSSSSVPHPDNNIEALHTNTSPINLQGLNSTFHANIRYGQHQRNTFDIFLPQSPHPSALVMYIHGGGFTSGDKSFVYQKQKDGAWDLPSDIRQLLTQDIAVASINYRLLDQEGVLPSLQDVQYALQFMRFHADTLNIDKTNIVLAGNSAGAGSALWVALQDEQANINHLDPIKHESTRVKGVAVRETQSTYDLRRWESDVFYEYGFNFDTLIQQTPKLEPRINTFYGIDTFSEIDSEAIKSYRSQVDMLSFMDSSDPELWIDNTLRPVKFPSSTGIMNHHAYHARTLKTQADQVGIRNWVTYGKDPVLYTTHPIETWTDFAIRKLNS